MINKLSRFIVSVAGLGHVSPFPGTLASLAALVIGLSIGYLFNKNVFVVSLLLISFIGFLSISFLQKGDEKKDYSWIVIDEWMGMWIALLPIFYFDLNQREILFYSLAALLLFRIIDILKIIPPIKLINNYKKQTPLFIVLDDIVAGLYVYLILVYAIKFFSGSFSLAEELRAIFFLFIFLAPAMVANTTPVLVRKLQFLNRPISQKIFGANKTWRGLFFGVVAGMLVSFIFYKLKLFPIELSNFYSLALGCLLSLGALGGDLIKSFFKRRQNIKEGENFAPWDQVDYIIGVTLISLLFYTLSLKEVVIWLIIGGLASFLAHRLAYFLKLINTRQ